LFHIGCSLS